jgi:elongation factor P
MILSNEVKAGMVIHQDRKLLRVIEAIHHAGSAQQTGFLLIKCKELQTGHFSEHRYKGNEKLDVIELQKRTMEFLYRDENSLYFMDVENYDQIEISKIAVGPVERFLSEQMKVPVELYEGRAVNIQLPKHIELKVIMTGTPTKAAGDNTMKTAQLENQMEILVPQFVETGDMIRVETDTGKYFDRIPLKK